MSWFLIVYFVSGVTVVEVDSKLSCEVLRTEISAAYGQGTAFVSAKCISVQEPPRKK